MRLPLTTPIIKIRLLRIMLNNNKQQYIKCLVCKEILKTQDAYGHMVKTGHNRWELIVE